MKNHGLLLIKNSRFSKIQDLDFEKLNGFSFKPRNNIAYGGILVSKCVMFNPSYTETILKKNSMPNLPLPPILTPSDIPGAWYRSSPDAVMTVISMPVPLNLKANCSGKASTEAGYWDMVCTAVTVR